MQDLLAVSQLLVSKILWSLQMQKALLDLCEIKADQKFQLLYQASVHGYKAKNFHSKCDNQPNTLTIIKSHKGNIFGGFVAAKWKSGISWESCPQAYIFSLVNKNKSSFKTPINVYRPFEAIHCHFDNGPCFGVGQDIHIVDRCDLGGNFCNFSSTYPHKDYFFKTPEATCILAGAENFKVVELEVYRVL